jgi:hypothetical protein
MDACHRIRACAFATEGQRWDYPGRVSGVNSFRAVALTATDACLEQSDPRPSAAKTRAGRKAGTRLALTWRSWRLSFASALAVEVLAGEPLAAHGPRSRGHNRTTPTPKQCQSTIGPSLRMLVSPTQEQRTLPRPERASSPFCECAAHRGDTLGLMPLPRGGITASASGSRGRLVPTDRDVQGTWPDLRASTAKRKSESQSRARLCP